MSIVSRQVLPLSIVSLVSLKTFRTRAHLLRATPQTNPHHPHTFSTSPPIPTPFPRQTTRKFSKDEPYTQPLHDAVLTGSKTGGMQGWGNVVESQIKRGRDAGAFEDLSTRGKPLELQSPPPGVTSTDWLLTKTLGHGGKMPPWIEAKRNIDEGMVIIERTVREALRDGVVGLKEGNRVVWVDEAVRKEVEEKVKKLNDVGLAYNMTAPTVAPQVLKVVLDTLVKKVSMSKE